MAPALSDEAKRLARQLKTQHPDMHYYTIALQLQVDTGVIYKGLQVKNYLESDGNN